MDAQLCFESFPESWNCISVSDYGYDTNFGSWGGGMPMDGLMDM